jgi:biotin operon repressor
MMLAEALRTDVYQTKRELAEKLRTTPRDVEQAIERARKSGSLAIMSGPDGYRLARNPDEYELNVQTRRKRALGQLVTVRGERDYINRWREHLNPKPPPPPPAPQPEQESLGW